MSSNRPTLASTIALNPQTRMILAHLERRRSISFMEALVTYGISRLSARIFELRSCGYPIVTDMRRDEAGKAYARYRLAA